MNNVTINKDLCTNPSWKDQGSIVCTAPQGAGKNNSVVVTVGNQISSAFNGYDYDGNVLFLLDNC